MVFNKKVEKTLSEKLINPLFLAKHKNNNHSNTKVNAFLKDI